MDGSRNWNLCHRLFVQLWEESTPSVGSTPRPTARAVAHAVVRTRFCENGNGFQLQSVAGFDDAACYFCAICNQNNLANLLSFVLHHLALGGTSLVSCQLRVQ
jgi:hypothetical protein